MQIIILVIVTTNTSIQSRYCGGRSPSNRMGDMEPLVYNLHIIGHQYI